MKSSYYHLLTKSIHLIHPLSHFSKTAVSFIYHMVVDKSDVLKNLSFQSGIHNCKNFLPIFYECLDSTVI